MPIAAPTSNKPFSAYPNMMPTPYASQVDPQTGLTSMRWTIKLNTQNIHHRVERLPLNADLMNLQKEIPVECFQASLFHKYSFLKRLEELLLEKEPLFNQDPHSRDVLAFFKTVFRAEAFKATLENLSPDHQLPPWTLPFKVEAYIQRLDTVAAEDPRLLFIHAWANLLDGLFGGQFMAPKVEERWGGGATVYLHYPEQIVGSSAKPGARLKNARELVKERFQKPLDAIPWTDHDYHRATEEAFAAFQVIEDSLKSIGYASGSG